jgi:two-component sensor histidine kinase
MSWAGSDALIWDAERLRVAADAAGIGLWSWNVDTDEIAMDERGHALWGVPRGGVLTFERLSASIAPPDLGRVRSAFAATRTTAGSYQIDFRVLRGAETRWISAHGRGADGGIVGRIMFGVFLDSTARNEAEEARDLLAGEMSHRVKNLLAIAAGLTHITSRSTSTTADMARELTQRLTALGRAHDLVRPLPGGQGQAALLGDLLTVLLAPYDDLGAFSGRIRVAVERMGIGAAAATSLALVVHELATNSLKYGALSSATGTLDVATTAPTESQLDLIWMERGGPSVSEPPGIHGFGSKLVHRSVSKQLGGTISYDWTPEGLIVTLRLERTMLAI